MTAFVKNNWAYLTIALLAGIILYQYTHPTSQAPTGQVLSKKQEKQAKAALEKSAEVVAADTVAANRANVASDKLYTQGAAAAARAQVLRLKTHKPHAASIPASDTAALRLQRFFANW